MNKPVLMVVDDDPQVLAAVRRDLRTRYREDYSIVGAASGEQALDALRDLKARGDDVAMVVSDQRMPGMHGTEVLTRTRDVYPDARRVLLTAYSDIDAAIKAINDAHLDHYLSKPWAPPEEKLYPVVDELLDSWKAEYSPELTGLRLVGHQWSPRSHEIKDFLASNLVPYRWVDIDRQPAVAAELLESKGLGADALPVVFFADGDALQSPEPQDVARRLGLPMTAARDDVYDLVIVGGGPAGLAAAVYGASEGLQTLLLDRHAAGGQAGASSRIENYLGFPAGVSGRDLTNRALTQAKRLGAECLVPIEVAGITVEAGYKHVHFVDGRSLVTRTLLASTGMVYREHPAAGIAEHTSAGVYYGAATTEAPVFTGKKVVVVGGGNSAGQGAMHLSRYASEVHIVVRGESLAATMSRYLICQIEKTPNIRLRTRTEITRVDGTDHVERVTFVSPEGIDEEAVEAVFIFIGTRPRSEWLPSEVLRDPRGFVLTGRDLMAHKAYVRIWKEAREPLPLETSVPGIFAAGDIRASAMNRVASAVGEGSMVVRFVHEYLALT